MTSRIFATALVLAAFVGAIEGNDFSQTASINHASQQ